MVQSQGSGDRLWWLWFQTSSFLDPGQFVGGDTAGISLVGMNLTRMHEHASRGAARTCALDRFRLQGERMASDLFGRGNHKSTVAGEELKRHKGSRVFARHHAHVVLISAKEVDLFLRWQA